MNRINVGTVEMTPNEIFKFAFDANPLVGGGESITDLSDRLVLTMNELDVSSSKLSGTIQLSANVITSRTVYSLESNNRYVLLVVFSIATRRYEYALTINCVKW